MYFTLNRSVTSKKNLQKKKIHEITIPFLNGDNQNSIMNNNRNKWFQRVENSHNSSANFCDDLKSRFVKETIFEFRGCELHIEKRPCEIGVEEGKKIGKIMTLGLAAPIYEP